MNTINPNHDSTDTKIWTTRRLLSWVTQYFEKHGIDSPRLSAEILLAHVLKCERLHLYMEVDRPSSDDELKELHSLVARAARHEPIAYLIGDSWFFGLQFQVTRDTLIPRPSTETIVEQVLQHYRQKNINDTTINNREETESSQINSTCTNPHITIVDIGTGSGVIAVTLAKHIENVRILATDISEAALQVARANALTHKVNTNIEFIQGSLLEPLRNIPVILGDIDYLVSNPPYISDKEWEAVAPNVTDYEPTSALRGGQDGLDYIKPLLLMGPEYLRIGGQLLIEIADSQVDPVLELARQNSLLGDWHILDDFEGLPRVLAATRV